jgi:hypothetical protein
MFRALGIFCTFALATATCQTTGIQISTLYSSSKMTKFVDEDISLVANDSQPQGIGFLRPAPAPKLEKFHWGRAIAQSANFMAIQQGIMFASDKWTRYQFTHGKWFKTYVKAIRGNDHWDDGDPTVDNYIGHPIQGALTGFIQIQNDPAGRHLEFENTRAYWKSRMKAFAWNAAYSTQFEIGPFGEASIQKLGSYYYRNCPDCKPTNGAGFVDFVITPTVGTGWLITEDLLDKYVPAKLERRFGRNGWTNLLRCVLNPARTGANILNHKSPWYRGSRDVNR